MKKVQLESNMTEFQLGFSRCLNLLGYSKKITSIYSKEFEEALIRYFGTYVGHEKFQQWWDDHTGGRVAHALKVFIPWLERYASIDNKIILEIGCGTGSSTVALALKAKKVIAVDIHAPSLEVARIRLLEDGLSNKVEFFQIDPLFEELKQHKNTNIVVLYGVLEHMLPLERQTCIDKIWDMMEEQGVLVIYECPNRLWPKDIHTTGLLGWSWLPPRLALSYGKFRRKFNKLTSLEEMYREGFGLTFWELDQLFAGKHYEYLECNSKENLIRKGIASVLMKILSIPRWALCRNINSVIKKQ